MAELKRKLIYQHPGILLKSELIDSRGLTINSIAKMLKVSRQSVSSILNEHASISPEMAVRISKVFGGTADIWMRLQMKYDLHHAEQKIAKEKLQPFL